MPPIASPHWMRWIMHFNPSKIYTGVCYGVEALLRNTDTAGFETIGGFFDRAWRDGVLHLPSGRQIYTTDEISRTLAKHKKKAKCSPTSMFVHTVCIEKTDGCVSHAFQTCLPEKDFQRRVSYHNFDPEKEIFDSPARFAPVSGRAVQHASV